MQKREYTYDLVRAAVENEIAEFQERKNLSPTEINEGMCDVFAENVLYELGVKPSRTGTEFQMMNVQMLQVKPRRNVDAEDTMGLRFDRAKIKEQWPETVPPAGMTWDEMDAVSGYALLDEGTHTWFRFKERHYDSETPGGCASIFDLPLFKYHIGRWIEAGKPEYQDKSEYPGSLKI